VRPALRFGEAFHDEIAASDAIRLALNANLVDLRLDDALGTVTEAHFRSLEVDDPGFAVRARAFVLCAGGIENPRILLNARSQIPTGIGNQHDLVGRFFCEHPYHVGRRGRLRGAVP
jgi:choline dehydrogenase-like flavoprotein